MSIHRRIVSRPVGFLIGSIYLLLQGSSDPWMCISKDGMTIELKFINRFDTIRSKIGNVSLLNYLCF